MIGNTRTWIGCLCAAALVGCSGVDAEVTGLTKKIASAECGWQIDAMQDYPDDAPVGACAGYVAPAGYMISTDADTNACSAKLDQSVILAPGQALLVWGPLGGMQTAPDIKPTKVRCVTP